MKTKRQQALFMFFLTAIGLAGICGQIPRAYGADPVPVLVRDIFPGVDSGIIPPAWSDKQPFVNLSGVLYFGAQYASGVTECGLFRSNGTSIGTLPVLGGFYPRDMIAMNGTLYFSTTGNDLWKSDGTSVGTILLAHFSGVFNLTGVDHTLFFGADDGMHGYELWKSDGTPGGTVMVKDICSGVTRSLEIPDPYGCTDFAVMNGLLYFSASDSGVTQVLWQSDGTAAGTVPVPLSDPEATLRPIFITNVNGVLYYTTNEDALWRSNGTDAGTIKLADGIDAWELTYANNKIFFNAGYLRDWELWVTDGTVSGTTLVKDIYSGVTAGNPERLINVNNTLYFSADDGMNGCQLWKSDGTANGTVMVKRINPTGDGIENIFAGMIHGSAFINMNGALYFRANDGVHGMELWKSDGTESGTTMVMDICSGVTGSMPVNFTDVNGTLFFAANDGTNGLELWKMAVYTPNNNTSGSSGGGGGGCFIGAAGRVSGFWLLVLGLGAVGIAGRRHRKVTKVR